MRATLAFLGNPETTHLPTITIAEFVSVYRDAGAKEREAGQIKYAMVAYKGAVETAERREHLENMIMGGEVETKQVVRELDRVSLPKHDKAKLDWKWGRLGRFEGLVAEEHTNALLVR
jgi:hypothetical protein